MGKNENHNVDDESSKVILSHEQALDSAIQNEVSFVTEMEYLHTLLEHPGLKGNVLSLEKCIHIISNILTAHRNLKEELSDKSCLVSCAFFNFMPHLKIYLDYASCVERVNICIKEITNSCVGELWKQSTELLFAPVNHLKKYPDVIGNLIKTLSEQEAKPLKNIVEAIEKTISQVNAIYDSTNNALKLLQIQRSLIGGQPKIFTPGRTFLKDGCLEKMKNNGHSWQQRIFFLFSDLLMCCKKIKNVPNWHEPSTLSCRSVIPLNICSLHPVWKYEDRQNVFEIRWQNNSYTLFSKTAEDFQTWVNELECAIKRSKQLLFEDEKRKTLPRNTLLRRAIQLQLQSTSDSNIPSGNSKLNNENGTVTRSISKKKSSLKESFRLLFR